MHGLISGVNTNGLETFRNSKGVMQIGGSFSPIWDYEQSALITKLPAYQGTRAILLAPLLPFLNSNDYEFWMVAVPTNEEECLIQWKKTHRDQVTIPAGSYLIGISALAVDADNGESD